MNINTVSGDLIATGLRQMGAESVKEVHGIMYIVNFVLNSGNEVSYVFNITKGDKFFLQRMRPYAIPYGKFANAEEIIEFIKKDIEQFRNAECSRNFGKFVEMAENIGTLMREMEHLFLLHNVNEKYLDEINQEIKILANEVRVLHQKMPEILL